MNELQRYADFAPTPCDSKGMLSSTMGFGDEDDCDRSEWLLAPVSQTRDSGPCSQSNFETLEAMLDEADEDSADHENHRFGHWGPGWFEILLVRPESKCADIAQECADALADYPLLDDEDASRREFEEACEAWVNTTTQERIEICAKHDVSIFAARREEIPQGLPHFEDFYQAEG